MKILSILMIFNKEINPNNIGNVLNKVSDVASFYNNLDLNLIDNLFQSLGFGKYIDIIGPGYQEMKEMLNAIKFLIELIYKYKKNI